MAEMNPAVMFLVGQHRGDAPWELQGLYAALSEAVARCVLDTFFVTPIAVGIAFPIETTDAPDRFWYPKLQPAPPPGFHVVGWTESPSADVPSIAAKLLALIANRAAGDLLPFHGQRTSIGDIDNFVTFGDVRTLCEQSTGYHPDTPDARRFRTLLPFLVLDFEGDGDGTWVDLRLHDRDTGVDSIELVPGGNCDARAFLDRLHDKPSDRMGFKP